MPVHKSATLLRIKDEFYIEKAASFILEKRQVSYWKRGKLYCENKCVRIFRNPKFNFGQNKKMVVRAI